MYSSEKDLASELRPTPYPTHHCENGVCMTAKWRISWLKDFDVEERVPRVAPECETVTPTRFCGQREIIDNRRRANYGDRDGSCCHSQTELSQSRGTRREAIGSDP
ncbi:hypothetical protein BJV77DRAFT_260495 [Russula vinacea]|nr:hypothetical protein BJV77DRAFT_260495 [Russula vinacea]